MSKIDDGGPAFPVEMRVSGWSSDPLATPVLKQFGGMSLRDYFAAHCPDTWIERNTPDGTDAMRRELLKRKIIASTWHSGGPLETYSEIDTSRLYTALRYEYADAMLAARATRGTP